MVDCPAPTRGVLCNYSSWKRLLIIDGKLFRVLSAIMTPKSQTRNCKFEPKWCRTCMKQKFSLALFSNFHLSWIKNSLHAMYDSNYCRAYSRIQLSQKVHASPCQHWRNHVIIVVYWTKLALVLRIVYSFIATAVKFWILMSLNQVFHLTLIVRLNCFPLFSKALWS